MFTSVSADLDTLVALLVEDVRLYGDLLAIGARERGAILGRDPADLNVVIAEKEVIVASIGRVERGRQEWLAAWARETGVSEIPTLAQILEHASGAAAERARALRADLLALLRDVAEMNYRNGQLLSSALGIVDRSIDAFSRVREGAGYEARGTTVRSARTAVLDYRA